MASDFDTWDGTVDNYPFPEDPQDDSFVDDPRFVAALIAADRETRFKHEAELKKNFGRLPKGYRPSGAFVDNGKGHTEL